MHNPTVNGIEYSYSVTISLLSDFYKLKKKRKSVITCANGLVYNCCTLNHLQKVNIDFFSFLTYQNLKEDFFFLRKLKVLESKI